MGHGGVAIPILLRKTGEAMVKNLKDRLVRERKSCREVIDHLLNRYAANGDLK